MKALWITLLIAFGAVNVYAITVSDLAALWGFVKAPGPWGFLLIADLLTALTILLNWLFRDAHQRGVNPLPYLFLTLATGSIGILLYLIVREPQQNPQSATA